MPKSPKIKTQNTSKDPTTSVFLTNYKDYLKDSTIYAPTRKSHRIYDALEERKNIVNKSLTLDMTLKKFTLIALFIFLAIETLLVFLFTFWQAVGVVFFTNYNFKLDQWSFRLLLAATILQITAMLTIAVKNLFPQKGSKQK